MLLIDFLENTIGLNNLSLYLSHKKGPHSYECDPLNILGKLNTYHENCNS